jgi:hypothetical protein
LSSQLKVLQWKLTNGPERNFNSVKKKWDASTGAIGVTTTNVPKFNYISSKFSKTLVLVGPFMVSSSISLHCPSTST